MILVIPVLLLTIGIAGIGKLRLNSHYSVYFDVEDPLIVDHMAIAERFRKPDSVIIVLQRASTVEVVPDFFHVIEDVSSALSSMTSVVTVDALSTLGIIGDEEFQSGEFLPSISQLQSHERVPGLLLSQDTRFALIRVGLNLADKSAATVLSSMDEIRSTVADATENRRVSAHYTGTMMLNEAYIRVVRHDLRIILPTLLVLACLVLLVAFRTASAIAIVLPIAILSTAFAAGVGGLMKAELAAINSFTPVIILSISLAGCVHVMTSFARLRRDAGAALAAARAIKSNLLPMTIANGTTALGFVALTLSPSPPVQVLGMLVAAGVVGSYLLCACVLPALLARIDPPLKLNEHAEKVPISIVKWALNNRRAVVVVFSLLGILSAGLANKNAVSDSVLEYFSDTHVFHQDTSLVQSEFSGITELSYSLDFVARNALLKTESIADVERFTAFLRQQPDVQRVTSITDSALLRDAIFEGRLEERLDNYRRELESLDSKLPASLQDVSTSYSATLVSVYLQPTDSADITAFDRRIKAWVEHNLPDVRLTSGGPALMFAYLGQNNIMGMLIALSAALLVAAVVFGIVFRSVRVAAIGAVCNGFPVLLVYAIWALSSGQISLGAAIVMGMIVGIVIDDTVYLLAYAQRATISDQDAPAVQAVRRVGPALVITSVALAAGLANGVLSDFEPIWSMSVLSVAIIIVALLTDLILLPALLPDPRETALED